MMRKHLSISNSKKLMLCLIKISIVFIVTLAVLTAIFKRTSDHNNLFHFYEVKRNSLDVVNIGSSHVHHSINTVEMYDKMGIKSYNLSGPAQSIWNSYYYLKEMLKRQRPQVVLLDVYTITLEDDKFESSIQMNLQAMRPSWNKYQALKANGLQEQFWEVWFNFPLNHDCYSSLERKDYEIEPEWKYMSYYYSNDVEELEPGSVANVHNVTSVSPITPKAEEYLRRCIELCRQEGIAVVLINAPWPGISEAAQEKYNYVQQIADEYGIDFLNGCLLHQELDMDWSRDNAGNGGHLNYDGSLKWTHYLMNYLEENFELPDHRNERDPSWERARGLLHQRIAQHNLRDMENPEDVLRYFALDDKIPFAAVFNLQQPASDEICQLAQMFGLSITPNFSGYILRDTTGMVNSGSDIRGIQEFPMGDSIIKIMKNSGVPDGDPECMGMLFHADSVHMIDECGITIMVYDPYRDETLWAEGFETE